MTELDDKINEHFAGLVVRKDLVKTVKGNAIVPSYVLEYLLGQYCATADEESIKTGIDTVKDVLRKHYAHRSESGLIKSVIKEKGRHKVIDRVSVALNDTKDVYEASFANLGIKKVLVDSDTVKKHPKLLVSGVWTIVDMEYEHFEDKSTSPWIINKLKPIQLSYFDYDNYLAARKQFTTDEWIDLLIQSIGFNPEKLGKRSKLLQLVRLIPFCERNYNLIELGPKGTGKSHIFSDFSPHGILISGGEITVPKLFVNNSSGKIGLVGYWDTVAFDEFAGKKKRANKALVDIMKNYMANKSFSRGVETIGAEASMVFVGNTRHTLPYMLKHTDLFEELPEQYYDSAFLDRIHFYLPGWEVDIIRGEMFSDGYGFVVDYLAEILRSLRNHDYSDHYSQYYNLVSDISTRDKDGINKTFSGMMKILFPHQEATKQEIEEVLQFAIEGRKRVKDQLMKIDSTYAAVRFAYTCNDGGETIHVKSLEEEEYPQYFGSFQDEESEGETDQGQADQSQASPAVNEKPPELKERQVIVKENQRGVTYDKLFGQYFQDAKKITVTDSYIRIFNQIRNLNDVHHKASTSAYPREVTQQMVKNFLDGGAAINVLCRHHHIDMKIVDMGVDADFDPHPDLIVKKVRKGTRNFALEPAMTRQEMFTALGYGMSVFLASHEASPMDIVGVGEMGIGNTTSASAIIATICGITPGQATGRGTGVDNKGLSHKTEVIEKALAFQQPDPRDGLDILEKVGGYEIAGIAGAVLAAASRGCAVVLDGVISTAVGLLACVINPDIRGYLISGHKSVEVAQKSALEYMDITSVIDFKMRLGEGTGAALTMDTAEAACKIMCEMASFDDAGVAGKL